MRQSNRGKGRHSADVLVPQMPYVQIYATELFSSIRAAPPCRRISSPLHDMRAHRVRSRRLRGSPVSLLRVRLQRIHTGRCPEEACGATRRLSTIRLIRVHAGWELPSRHAAWPTDQPARFRSSSSIVGSIATAGTPTSDRSLHPAGTIPGKEHRASDRLPRCETRGRGC